MSKTDIRLLYQKDSGLGLEVIKDMVDCPEIEVVCENCNELGYGRVDYNSEAKAYIEWLEEEFEKSLSVGDLMLHQIARLTFQNTKLQVSNEKSEPKG